MENKLLVLITLISLTTAAISVLLLTASYSKSDAYTRQITPKTPIFEIKNNPEPLVYEVPELNPSHEAWMKSTRQQRNKLNIIRDKYNAENEYELREDKKKSENWSAFINGEIVQGYDVIRRERGDFAEKVPPKRHPTRARAAVAVGYY